MDIQDLIEEFETLKQQHVGIALTHKIILSNSQTEPCAKKEAEREFNRAIGFITALNLVICELEKIAE